MPRPKKVSLDINIYKGISFLLILNILIFFYSFQWAEFINDPLNLELNEDIRDDYGFKPSEILEGKKIYTSVTSMFFHDDLLHILGNMVALFLMGCMVEKRLGTKRFLLLYFISGLAAVGLSCAIYPNYGEDSEDESIIGASAAVYGVVASAVIWRPHVRIKWPLTSFIAALIIYPFARLFKYMIPEIGKYFGTILSDKNVDRIILVITILFILFVIYVLYKTVKVKLWIFTTIFVAYSLSNLLLYEGDLALISLVGHLGGFITGLILYPIIAKLEKQKRKITTS